MTLVLRFWVTPPKSSGFLSQSKVTVLFIYCCSVFLRSVFIILLGIPLLLFGFVHLFPGSNVFLMDIFLCFSRFFFFPVSSWEKIRGRELFGPWMSDNVFIVSFHLIDGGAGYSTLDWKSSPSEFWRHALIVHLHFSVWCREVQCYSESYLFWFSESFMKMLLCLECPEI